jgi:diguanylate cyclase (GGDEF)-like protein
LPRRAPETVAQLILADLLAERPPPPESFSTFDLKDLPPPNFTSDPEHQSEVIELSSSTGNSAFLVLLTASASDIENKKSLFFPVLVQAQRTFQNLDLAAALSYVDELTGLYNRRFLDVALSNEIARAHRYRAPIAVLFIDLDKFKEVNDTFGHIVGSAILQAASQLFRQCMRDADQLLRYGGDEFVAILPSTNTQGAAVVAERIRASFCDVTFDVSEETGISEAVSISVTTSIGVACYPEVSTDARELVQMADNAMYESKRAGKNKVTVSQPGSQQGQQSHRDGNLRKLPESG